MHKVDISFMGRSYALNCAAGQEARLEALAGYVDGKLRQIAAGQTAMSESRLFMLAALTLADEVFDLKADLDKARQNSAALAGADEELLISAIEYLTKRVNDIAVRAESA